MRESAQAQARESCRAGCDHRNLLSNLLSVTDTTTKARLLADTTTPRHHDTTAQARLLQTVRLLRMMNEMTHVQWLCVRVCVCARARACVCACVRASERVRVRVCVLVRALTW
jgi:hypothetical protein